MTATGTDLEAEYEQLVATWRTSAEPRLSLLWHPRRRTPT